MLWPCAHLHAVEERASGASASKSHPFQGDQAREHHQSVWWQFCPWDKCDNPLAGQLLCPALYLSSSQLFLLIFILSGAVKPWNLVRQRRSTSSAWDLRRQRDRWGAILEGRVSRRQLWPSRWPLRTVIYKETWEMQLVKIPESYRCVQQQCTWIMAWFTLHPMICAFQAHRSWVWVKHVFSAPVYP